MFGAIQYVSVREEARADEARDLADRTAIARTAKAGRSRWRSRYHTDEAYRDIQRERAREYYRKRRVEETGSEPPRRLQPNTNGEAPHRCEWVGLDELEICRICSTTQPRTFKAARPGLS